MIMMNSNVTRVVRKVLFILCVGFLVFCVFHIKPQRAEAAKKTSVQIQVNNKKVKLELLQGKIKSEKGKLYFYKEGRKKSYRGGFFLYKKQVYYAAKTGVLLTGWQKIRGNYYFFTRDRGRMVRDKEVELVSINPYGIVKSKKGMKRAKTYVKARQIVEKISKASDSKEKKLYQCYLWLEKFPYHQYRTLEEVNLKSAWDLEYANDIFQNKQGCCVSEASAFAMLAVACGYKKVTLCADGGHSWVDINYKLYDPLFAEARDFASNYNANYSDYRRNPLIKRRYN